jgi:HEAT repeats
MGRLPFPTLQIMETARFSPRTGHTPAVMKRGSIVLVLFLVAIAGVVVWRGSTRPVPVYQGRTVDAWLDAMAAAHYATTSSRSSDYEAALEHMGPQAVPFIFRKMEQDDSPWRNKYRDFWPKFPGFFQKHLPQPKPIAFGVWPASRALVCCGTNAIRVMLGRLNAWNPAVREAAWFAVDSLAFGRSQISTNETISLCVPALKDHDAVVRGIAAECLGRLGIAASNAVPALVPLLSSSEAGLHGVLMNVHAITANALGKIGPSATQAVPVLTNLLATGDSEVRVRAAVALWQITSNENLALPVIINELPSFVANAKYIPINALASMGPHAKAVFPSLLNELPFAQDPYERGLITNALKAIDPDAAAKAGIK